MDSSGTPARRPHRTKADSTVNAVATVKAVSLIEALTQNEEVHAKMERWADELSAINEVLAQELSGLSHSAALERALDRSEELESNIQASAEAVSSINVGLVTGISAGKKLTRKLLSSNTKRKEIGRLAFYDALTGLPNRLLFNDRLKQVLAQAARHGRGVAVMFIDLDGFKLVNDSYGHDVGDTVLRHVAQRLQASMRAEDTVSRHGGDEFLCIMMEANDERDIAKVAVKMINVIAALTEVGDVKVIVKPSIGIAVYPQDGETAKVLVTKADTAMYRAKRTRKGYVFFNHVAVQ
jgi:diguanylate cyclase (GGDEF)-like protein